VGQEQQQLQQSSDSDKWRHTHATHLLDAIGHVQRQIAKVLSNIVGEGLDEGATDGSVPVCQSTRRIPDRFHRHFVLPE
jgi:hypothetical protein